MLVKAGDNRGIDVLLVRRSSASAFAPDAFVFPGGTVDTHDYDQPPAWDKGRIEAEFRARADAALPSSEPDVAAADALALVAAAVRELHEEVGIDLGAPSLHLFSHWITPPSEPRRYNTHFFLAAAADHHIGVADRVETHDERWIAPADALALYQDGRLHLVYPTIKHLERLAAFSEVPALLEYARTKPIVTIMPETTPDEGFVMPAALEGRW